MKQQIEEAVVDCNIIIKRWKENKPKLYLDYNSLKGLVIHHLKKAIYMATGWKNSRGFFSSRILFMDIDTEAGFVKSIVVKSDGVSSVSDPRYSTLTHIFENLNYIALNNKAEERKPAYYSEVNRLSLENLNKINFITNGRE